MKRLFMLLIAGSLLITSCSKEETNTLLAEWDTPFETPPFEKIKTEHYLPAFKEAIKIHNSEIEKIINNSEEATFPNTIEALDYSGKMLRQVRRVFSAMNSAMSNDELQAINKEVFRKICEIIFIINYKLKSVCFFKNILTKLNCK